jgi:hypothetical protein
MRKHFQPHISPQKNIKLMLKLKGYKIQGQQI